MFGNYHVNNKNICFQQLLRLVYRLDEENVCRTHERMPDFNHSDRDDKLDSEGEMDGMMEPKDLPDWDKESDISDTTTTDDSSDS